MGPRREDTAMYERTPIAGYAVHPHLGDAPHLASGADAGAGPVGPGGGGDGASGAGSVPAPGGGGRLTGVPERVWEAPQAEHARGGGDVAAAPGAGVGGALCEPLFARRPTVSYMERDKTPVKPWLCALTLE